MPESLSLTPLRATCNKNANYLRKYNVRSAKGLSGVGREGGRGAWIVLQVVSASGECSLVLCWTQNCKSCNLCALRLRTASAISTNCLIYDQSGFSIVYVCVCTCVCAVCTNFSNHTKPDSAEILIIVCEAASQSITQISCSTSKDDDGGICNVSRQAQDSAVRA